MNMKGNGLVGSPFSFILGSDLILFLIMLFKDGYWIERQRSVIPTFLQLHRILKNFQIILMIKVMKVNELYITLQIILLF